MSDKIGVIKEIDANGSLVIPKEMWELFEFGADAELIVTQDGVLARNPGYKLVKIENREGDQFGTSLFFCCMILALVTRVHAF